MKWIWINLLLWANIAAAQPSKQLSLQQAQAMAQQNYPLVKQRNLVKQTAALNTDNLGTAFMPQVTLNGQATYQSEVTKLNIPLPGVTVSPLNKDQYKLLADVNQLLYDGGAIKEQKNIQQLNAAVEDQKIEVELYKIKDRINQVFLGVLFLDEQLKQVELIKADLNNGIKKVEAQVKNGVAFRSNLNLLNAELLKAGQRTIELTAARKGYIDVLGLFINETLPSDVILEKPSVANAPKANEIARPELQLFSRQQQLLQGQQKLLALRNQPKASFFVQGGYGRPGLNFLNNDFSFFYTTGLRLNWSLGYLYTHKKEKQLIDINAQTVSIQKETFLLNTHTQLKQQQAEIDKLQQLINSDAAIIDLRLKVKEAAKAQLENGVITANDYLREVNAEDQARQLLITHQIQLLQAKINYQNIVGQ
jgi:outer membrane protein TolC